MPRLVEDRLRTLADQVPLPDPEVADRVAARVAELHHARRPAPVRPTRRRGRLALGAVTALTGAAAALVVGVGSDGGARIDPAAAAALRRAAITAAHQPALPP